MQFLSRKFGSLQTCSYLILDDESGKGWWIDPAPGSAPWVDDVVGTFQLEAIVLTHTHWDHIADVGHSRRFPSLPIYVHPLDEANLLVPGIDGITWPRDLPAPKSEVMRHSLEEGMILTLGRHPWEVLHTPGHSRGSCCFFHREQKILIGGDMLLNLGFGRVDLPNSEPSSMRASIQRLWNLGRDVQLYPGHGEPSLVGELIWLEERFGKV